MASLQQNLTQVAMVSSPGMGHLIPLVKLAKNFVRHDNIGVTLIIPTMSPPSEAQKSLVQSLPNSISYVFLPQPHMEGLSPKNTKMQTLIILSVVRSLDFVRKELQVIVNSGCKLAAVVADFFSADCFDLAKEFNVPPYLFFSCSAMTLSTFFYLPKLDEIVESEFRELDHPVQVPGCIPIPGGELFDSLQDRKDESYKWMLHFSKLYKQAAGIMVNSFFELESGPFKAFDDPQSAAPPVYDVGPLVNSDGVDQKNEECLKWLDDQPPCSVLYVSFGSVGTLTSEQTTEMAMGLEMSEQRFIWVARIPSERRGSGEADPTRFLPDGFVERTKDRGLVVDSWAPQAKILSHVSTAGFLTHCGWNSNLEGIVNGVPFITWPLFAEQKMNALQLAEDVGVALRPRRSSGTGLVGRKEICEVVKRLIEGEEGKMVRNRMKVLKSAAFEALTEDGSSNRSIRRSCLLLQSRHL